MLYDISLKRSELQITSAVATHLAISFFFMLQSRDFHCDENPRSPMPEIFTKSNTMKLFHQADSQHWMGGGEGCPTEADTLRLM